jgi:hypothetical protein
MIGETLRQLAEDVFSEGAEVYNVSNSFEVLIDGRWRRFSDFEIAQLNDIASEMWRRRRWPNGVLFAEDDDWRLER